jgi:hypothetical protein
LIIGKWHKYRQHISFSTLVSLIAVFFENNHYLFQVYCYNTSKLKNISRDWVIEELVGNFISVDGIFFIESTKSSIEKRYYIHRHLFRLNINLCFSSTLDSCCKISNLSNH